MARPDVRPSPIGLRLNAFPLITPPGATLAYRLWRVDPLPKSPELREKIREELRWPLLQRPVAQRHVDGEFAYLVAEGGPVAPVEYAGPGAILYTIAPTDDVRTIALDGLDGTGDPAEATLAAALLQQALVRHLEKNPALFKGYRAGEFFALAPDDPYPGPNRPPARPVPGGAAVDIFRGFAFRVLPIAGAGLCAVLDVRTTYIGRRSVAEYLAKGGLPTGTEGGWGGARVVNDCGTIKQPAYLVRVTDRAIDAITRTDGRSTYAYLRGRYPQIRERIAPGDPAAMIMYRPGDAQNEGNHWPAATTLLKPKFGVGSQEVRGVGDVAAFPPEERAPRIAAAVGDLGGAPFGGGQVAIGAAVVAPPALFPLPDLVFGPATAPTRLNAGERTPGDVVARGDWGRRKLDALRQHGPLRAASFTTPYVVYPMDLDRDGLLDEFLGRTAAFCLEYGRATFAPEADSYRDNAPASAIIAKVQGLEGAGRAGFILLGLPPDPARAAQVYAGVKSRVKLPIKCFSAAKLRGEARRGRLEMYADRNALNLLVENGTRPWGLAQPLRHELHIGLDVARMKRGGLLGATVIGAPDGTEVSFHNEEIDRAERIPTPIVGRLVLRELERFRAAHGRAPRGLLVQRDGRLFDAELKGIRRAIEKFAAAHPDAPSPDWAAVAIEKRSAAPLRLFTEREGRAGRVLSGSYFVQGPMAAFLVLAGGPGLRQGTPHPIRVEIAGGSTGGTDLSAILGDIFALSQLNWGAPEIDISLPITLRFTDQLLERYALEPEEGGSEEDWEDE